MPVYRDFERPRGWEFRSAAVVLKPLLYVLGRRDWQQGMKLPATGGAVVAVNHISKIDPLMLAHLMYNHGRLPRFLAKDSLFALMGLGWFMRKCEQIPVAREGKDAAAAFEAAVTSAREGNVLMFYPEGSITRDPAGWPMRGKTGAARVGLTADVPVIPIGQWGAHEVLPAYSGKISIWPRHVVHYRVGDPVDLDDLRGQPLTAEILHEATDRIMTAIAALVGDLRHEQPPATRFDPRKEGISATGKVMTQDGSNRTTKNNPTNSSGIST